MKCVLSSVRVSHREERATIKKGRNSSNCQILLEIQALQMKFKNKYKVNQTIIMDRYQVETVLFSAGNVLLAGCVVSLIYKTRDIIPKVILHNIDHQLNYQHLECSFLQSIFHLHNNLFRSNLLWHHRYDHHHEPHLHKDSWKQD